MIYEAILETVIPTIRKILGYIFIEILIQRILTVSYATGFLIARLVTLGRFPKAFKSPVYIPRKHDTQQQGWVVAIGISFWCVLVFGSALLITT